MKLESLISMSCASGTMVGFVVRASGLGKVSGPGPTAPPPGRRSTSTFETRCERHGGAGVLAEAVDGEDGAGGGYVGDDNVDVRGEAGVAVLLHGVAAHDEGRDAGFGEDADGLAHGAFEWGGSRDFAQKLGANAVAGLEFFVGLGEDGHSLLRMIPHPFDKAERRGHPGLSFFRRLVLRHGGVDLVGPLEDAAGEVFDVREAVLLEDERGLLRACAGAAVDYNLRVLRDRDFGDALL